MPARPSLDAPVRAQGGVGSSGCTLGNGTAVYQHATSGAVSPGKGWVVIELKASSRRRTIRWGCIVWTTAQ